ncbi:hypothetical protein SALGADO_93 [Arthrobacter phage Salgado]|uniref:4Fe-4S Wbl-type domain-containing protein n=3 Tax=Laroyevirus TaxID=1982086 RepID=A0A0U4INT2_9CAUD|nr:transcriptional regulator WhiB-like [Arthrobacter phage Laroye]YP_010082603.1 transcriptional regulator WhiB-like [Arthrobacter phage LiSara]YP_010082702.1 transcriptional regulator WhiB-like [Arthrobacter phage Salgado]ALY09625.1 hypothetical protein LAROYE_93 [Arthrobacter phage Laroye]ALY10266.1 hypothetical protein SALGADO_93 [Arthrobacter phage Salgado]ASR83682.1 WhiB family transcription factor [Arthrobacter phage LiSara]
MTYPLEVPAAAWPLYKTMLEATEGDTTPCHMDPDLWFSTHRGEQIAAARMCLRCPVLEQCERYLAASNEPLGVWAARLPDDRTKRVTANVQGRALRDYRS